MNESDPTDITHITPNKWRTVHLGTVIQTSFGRMDEDGNVQRHDPVTVEIWRATEDAFLDARTQIWEAIEKAFENEA